MGSAFSQYLAERFPVGAYIVLIGAMVLAASASAVVASGAAVPVSWPQAIATVTLLLGFFVLRVFDEHKDYDRDVLAHPDRVLSRGDITLAQLRNYGIGAFVLQLALNVPLGVAALTWIGIYSAFAVGMRFEFGIGEWLNKHLVVYAITHNPIVVLMMAYVVVVTVGALAFDAAVIWWLLTATFTSLGFEIGRKLRAPGDEKEGQDTYTQALGIPGAVALLVVVEVLALGAAFVLLRHTAWALGGLGLVGLVMLGGPLSFLKSRHAKGAKLGENTSTLGALVIYILVFAEVAARQGVAWT